MKKLLLSLLGACILNVAAFSQTFTNINADIIDVYYTVTTWGDFDNDSDMDLFLAGQLADASDQTVLYINEGNDTFTASSVATFPPLAIGAAECADFNNDSYTDILVQAYNNATGAGYTKILENNGDGTFTELSAGFPQTYMGDVSCADFDNDSYVDVAISGFIDAAPYYISKIFKNNGDGTFSEVTGLNLPGTMYGKFKWADYNNDGYQDFVLSGYADDYVTEIYKNNGDGTFTNSGVDIQKGWLGDVEWGDYNGDGNIDLVVSGTGGSSGMERYCTLYKNNGDETFTEMNAGFPGVSHSALEWADFNGDGNLDLLICGTLTTPGEGNYVSAVYLNNGDDTFTESTTAQLPTVYWGDSKVADYDNNGTPDILLSGLDSNEVPYSAIFKNETQSNGYSVTFRVDMSNETVSADGIHIAGSFQGWDPGATLMSDAGNNIYEYTATFNEGDYLEYKFVNGDEWGEDESVPAGCAQNNNRFLTVPGQDTTLTAVCFGSCNPCAGQVTVTFKVDMSEQTVSADGIHVAGSFQGWDPAGTEMTDVGNNIYSVSYTVNSFEQIQYKFINGTSWDFAETVPEECGVPDGFGGFNRFLDVPDYDTTLIAVCFGSCIPCATGIDDNDFTKTGITGIYPNPFIDRINVNYYLADKANVELSVYSSFGKKITDINYNNTVAGMHSETIQMNNLSKGVYFLILRADGIIIQTGKIIK